MGMRVVVLFCAAAGTLYDIGWRQKLMLHCMGEGLPTGKYTEITGDYWRLLEITGDY